MRILVLNPGLTFVLAAYDASQAAAVAVDPEWLHMPLAKSNAPYVNEGDPAPADMELVDRAMVLTLPPADLVTYAKSVRDRLLETSRIPVVGCPVLIKTNAETQTALTTYNAAGKEDATLTITLTSSQGDQVLDVTKIKAACDTIMRWRNDCYHAYSEAKADLQSAAPTLTTPALIEAHYAAR